MSSVPSLTLSLSFYQFVQIDASYAVWTGRSCFVLAEVLTLITHTFSLIGLLFVSSLLYPAILVHVLVFPALP